MERIARFHDLLALVSGRFQQGRIFQFLTPRKRFCSLYLPYAGHRFSRKMEWLATKNRKPPKRTAQFIMGQFIVA